MKHLSYLEGNHSTYLKLEMHKKFPGKKLYFMADYPRPGLLSTPEFDFNSLGNLNDKLFFKIKPEHLEEIRNRKAFLVYESWIESGEIYIYWLYKKCIKANIPPEQVILLGSSFDYNDICKKYAIENGVKPITNVYYNFFERHVKKHYDPENDYDPLTNKLEKRYIYLNFTFRAHRRALLSMLHGSDLLKYGYVSYHNKAIERNFDPVSFMLDYFDEPVRTLIEKGANISDSFPLKLDDIIITPTSINPVIPIIDYVRKSFLHVVGETFYGTADSWINTTPGSPNYMKDKNPECVFLTEKVFNCIHFKQPFIVLSYPNSLEAFKRLGYKTFDCIIDESYDKEMDDTKRLYKVYSEIKRICELDESTLEEYRLRLAPILEHNFNIWMNKTNYMH